MLVKRLNQLKNFSDLSKEVLDLVTTINPEGNQIICQNVNPDTESWDTGIGRIEELEVAQEKEYTHIHSKLSGSCLEEIIKKYNGFRTRIMVMNSKSCYSVHADPTPRIHIPIVTSPQCWMIWPHHNTCHQLHPGHTYWTDTSKRHTFINGGLEQRIHIVMCVNSDQVFDKTV